MIGATPLSIERFFFVCFLFYLVEVLRRAAAGFGEVVAEAVSGLGVEGQA